MVFIALMNIVGGLSNLEKSFVANTLKEGRKVARLAKHKRDYRLLKRLAVASGLSSSCIMNNVHHLRRVLGENKK